MKCRSVGCDEPYRDFGDGFAGWCPSCADLLYVLEEAGRRIRWHSGTYHRVEIEHAVAKLREGTADG